MKILKCVNCSKELTREDIDRNRLANGQMPEENYCKKCDEDNI